MTVDHMHISFAERLLAKFGSVVRRLNEASENIQDRKSLARLKSCGKGVGVWGRFKVTCPERMEIGDNVHFGDNAFIRAEGGLTIGGTTLTSAAIWSCTRSTIRLRVRGFLTTTRWSPSP